MFVVINIMHADSKNLGLCESKHFTEEAAVAAIAKLQRAVKRRNGAEAYLPLEIVYVRGHVSKRELVPVSQV